MAKRSEFEQEIVKAIRGLTKKWRRGYFNDNEARQYELDLVALIEHCVKKKEESTSPRKE